MALRRTAAAPGVFLKTPGATLPFFLRAVLRTEKKAHSGAVPPCAGALLPDESFLFFFDCAKIARAFAKFAAGAAGGPDYRNQGSSTDLDV